MREEGGGGGGRRGGRRHSAHSVKLSSQSGPIVSETEAVVLLWDCGGPCRQADRQEPRQFRHGPVYNYSSVVSGVGLA